jgi:hypothetical protein
MGLQVAEPLTIASPPQPLIATPLSRKMIVPVGVPVEPETVAVKVTAWFAGAGFRELPSEMLGVTPQLPPTVPVPFNLNVAVPTQPAVMVIVCG